MTGATQFHKNVRTVNNYTIAITHEHDTDR